MLSTGRERQRLSAGEDTQDREIYREIYQYQYFYILILRTHGRETWRYLNKIFISF